MEISEKNTPTLQSNNKNKKKIIIIIGITLFIIIITIIVLIITLKFKSKEKICDSNTCDCNPNLPQCLNNCTTCDCNPELCCNSCDCNPTKLECININISHKLNEVNIYEESIIKTSTIIFNDKYFSDEKLKERSLKTNLNGKYLLNIYNIVIQLLILFIMLMLFL